VKIGGRLRADVFDPTSPVGAEIVVAQGVLLAIDNRFEAGLERRPLRRIDLDLELRISHALAEIAAGFRYPPQPPLAAPSAVLTS
jgi:hypothetical protein